jgi:cell division septation protein DedD
VAPVTAKQLKIWVAETDIAPGAGAARRGGKWSVITASVATQAEANKLAEALRVAGYAARIRLQTREKKPVYEVYLGQLASKADAEALAASIQGKMGVTQPRVSM